MKNKNGFWVSGMSAQRHIENIEKAIKAGEKEIALFDLRELSILLEKSKEENK